VRPRTVALDAYFATFCNASRQQSIDGWQARIPAGGSCSRGCQQQPDRGEPDAQTSPRVVLRVIVLSLSGHILPLDQARVKGGAPARWGS
jgi:hypothetical protein